MSYEPRLSRREILGTHRCYWTLFASVPSLGKAGAELIADARRLDERGRETGPDWLRGTP